jgi:hypothetical protein
MYIGSPAPTSFGLTTPKGPVGTSAVRAPSAAPSASKQERLEALRHERLRIMQAQASLLARPRSVARSSAGTPFTRPQASPGPSEEIDKLKSEIRQLKINEEMSEERVKELETALSKIQQPSEENDRLRQQLAREKEKVFALMAEKQRLEEEVQSMKVDKFRTEQLESEVRALKVQIKESGSWREERDRLNKESDSVRKELEMARNQYKTEKSQRLVLAAKIEQLEKDLRDAENVKIETVPFERRPTVLAAETVGVIAWKGPSPRNMATDYSPKSVTLPGIASKTVRIQESPRSVVRAPELAFPDPVTDLEGPFGGKPDTRPPVKTESFIDPFAAGDEPFDNQDSQEPFGPPDAIEEEKPFSDLKSGESMPFRSQDILPPPVKKVESFIDPFAAGESEYMGTPQREVSIQREPTSFIDVEDRGSAKKMSGPDIASIFGPSSPKPAKPVEPEWESNGWNLGSGPQEMGNPFQSEEVFSQQGRQPFGQQGLAPVHSTGSSNQHQFGQPMMPQHSQQSPFVQQGYHQPTVQGQSPRGSAQAFGSHLPSQGVRSQSHMGQYNQPPSQFAQQPQQVQFNQPAHQQVQFNPPTQQQSPQFNPPSQQQAYHQPAFTQQATGPFQNNYQQPQPAHIHPVMKQTIPGRPSPGSSPKEAPAQFGQTFASQPHAAFSRNLSNQQPVGYGSQPLPQASHAAFGTHQQPQGQPGPYGQQFAQQANQSPFGQAPPQFRQGPPNGPFRY